MPLWISPSKKFKTKKEAAPFETASFISYVLHIGSLIYFRKEE